MTDPSAPMPTDAELALLRVLWQRGPSTVREVHGRLDDVGYTTVLKQLQIMLDKGLVTRDESSRAHVYSAAVQQERMQRRLVDDLLDRAFGGSAQQLVAHALSGDDVSRDELQAIRSLIDELDADRDDDLDG
jgi:predicted transcriptional regulator